MKLESFCRLKLISYKLLEMVNNSEYEKMLKELKKRFKAAKTVAEKNKYKNLINMAERLKKTN
tara:strand:+ start:68 stop:256 length:189 start_codon:yes stop_codon:yes gene_type:complete